jgi:formate dehydrogenase beta subunit
LSKETKKVYKCTLCVDRVSVGLEPACIKACPTNCLTFGTKDVLLQKAESRVTQLKAAGFTEAAIYDPPGVGGTGVVSILAYGNSPGAYGLPNNPSISFAVEIWKGPLKWVGNFAIVGGIIGTFIHYLRFGPKHAPETDHKADAAGGGRQ